MAQLMYDNAGYYVEWYRDDDGNSGYGDNPRTTRWYCSRAEGLELVTQADPPIGAVWAPITGWKPDMSPGSAAWCECFSDMY